MINIIIVQGEGLEPSRAYANSLEDYDASNYVLTLLLAYFIYRVFFIILIHIYYIIILILTFIEH